MKNYKKIIYKYVPFIILILLLLIAGTVLNMVLPYISKFIIDDAIMKNDKLKLINLALLYIGLFLIGQVVNFIQAYLLRIMNIKIRMEMRGTLFRHICALEYRSVNQIGVSDLLNRVTNDITVVVSFVTSTISQILINVITLIVSLYIVATLNMNIFFITLAVCPLVLFIMFFFGNKIRDVEHKYIDQNNIFSGFINTCFVQLKQILYHMNPGYFTDKLDTEMTALKNIEMKSFRINALMDNLLMLLYFIPPLAILLVGGLNIIDGIFTVGGLLAAFSYLQRVFSPLRNLSGINSSIQNSIISYRRLKEVINMKEVDIPEPHPVDAISMDNIHFGFNENEIISDFSYRFEKGNLYKITGGNGRGKTTLIDILKGIYTPSKGTITFNSKPSRVAIVPQEDLILNGTIRENIVMDNKTANVPSIIEDIFPKDDIHKILDVKINDFGRNLSGGQKKKISILRTMLQNQSVLILDEPFNSLDVDSSKSLVRYLEQIKDDKIIIMIDHTNNCAVAEKDTIIL